MRILPKKRIFLEKLLILSVIEYIKHIQSLEEYSFSLEEAIENSSKDTIAVKREISRLIEKEEIQNLRKGFYLIIPPRYSKFGKLPIQLYVEKLFNYLSRKYYLGLYSAAKIHGASHQQIQGDYLITETPKLIDIKKKSFDIQFFTATQWPQNNIEIKKADAGLYKVSSPALTITDLVHYQNKIGGLNRVLTPFEELTEELCEKDIQRLTSWYNHKSTLQRVGFLLEDVIGNLSFSDIIYERLRQKDYFPVLLNPNKSQKPGKARNRWKIDVNVNIESDL